MYSSFPFVFPLSSSVFRLSSFLSVSSYGSRRRRRAHPACMAEGVTYIPVFAVLIDTFIMATVFAVQLPSCTCSCMLLGLRRVATSTLRRVFAALYLLCTFVDIHAAVLRFRFRFCFSFASCRYTLQYVLPTYTVPFSAHRPCIRAMAMAIYPYTGRPRLTLVSVLLYPLFCSSLSPYGLPLTCYMAHATVFVYDE